MAKNKNTPETNTSNTPDENLEEKEAIVSGDNETNIENNSIIEETMATTKTDEQIYKEISELKPKAKFQEYFDKAQDALKNNSEFKKKVITNSDNVSVPYEDIMANVPYSIKKHRLYFMFDLTTEQKDLLEKQTLFWFAQRRF